MKRFNDEHHGRGVESFTPAVAAVVVDARSVAASAAVTLKKFIPAVLVVYFVAVTSAVAAAVSATAAVAVAVATTHATPG